jgi:hypothetical protein
LLSERPLVLSQEEVDVPFFSEVHDRFHANDEKRVHRIDIIPTSIDDEISWKDKTRQIMIMHFGF